jgi:hypothetical protein
MTSRRRFPATCVGPCWRAAPKTNERYVREWLAAQAASGLLAYDAKNKTFRLTPEQAAVFADPHSPVNMTGGFYSLAAVFADEPKLAAAFNSGDGVGWGEHCNCLFCGTERFFRPGYKGHLANEWLPALDGVAAKQARTPARSANSEVHGILRAYRTRGRAVHRGLRGGRVYAAVR